MEQNMILFHRFLLWIIEKVMLFQRPRYSAGIFVLNLKYY
jgi:hypothetical protein